MYTTTTIRFNDDSAHRYAIEHATTVLGRDTEPSVAWDDDHHLQGHLEVSGRHLVLIAARATRHHPRLLDEMEWDSLRHGLVAA